MKISRIELWTESIPLSRPYTIAFKSTSGVELTIVRITTDSGRVGLGSASPVEQITGETVEACRAALAPDALDWLVGQDALAIGTRCRDVGKRLYATPAARAALDMALYDLFGRHVGRPVVDLLGRCHETLPTSITVGIKSTEETLADAADYVGRGFDHLKIKLGKDFAQDERRLRGLRQRYGREIRIRVDANQGYSLEEARKMADLAETYDLELVEQPLPAAAVEEMRGLPEALKRITAADESLHGEADALRLIREPRACGIFNIKLMKCGGITPALGIARIAEAAGVDLMWGCMDESVISITAALHAAFASPATRYLDLDGSFELSRDPAQGGFAVENGRLRIIEAPGLGVELAG